MGNKIHKVLGYGFSDVICKNDERFHSDFWQAYEQDVDILPKMREINNADYELCDKKENFLDYFEIVDFKNRIENSGWYKDHTSIKHLYFNDFVKMSGYFSEMHSAPLVFVHPFEKWSRLDDVIDYYSCDRTRDSFQLLVDDKGEKQGIYPYLNYVNKKTRQPVKCYPADRWILREDDASKHNLTLEEWKNDVVPNVPYPIKLFCKAVNAFQNPLTVYHLNAMIYNYWC